MIFFYNEYSTKIVKYDLLNKFKYKSLYNIPSLETVILKFDFKIYDYRLLIKCLVILNLLSNKRCNIIKSKKSNLSLKLKKGLPIGCKVILKKKKAFKFLISLLNNSKIIKNNFKVSCNNKQFSINLIILNILNLPQIQSNYHFFKNINSLQIKLITTSKSYDELIYLLNSYKIKFI